jgi:hypothetical protein
MYRLQNRSLLLKPCKTYHTPGAHQNGTTHLNEDTCCYTFSVKNAHAGSPYGTASANNTFVHVQLIDL